MSSRMVAPVVVVWFAGVAAAFGAVARYNAPPVEGVATWPAESAMPPAVGVENVVLFAAASSPSTGAKLAGLAELAVARPDVQVHVVIVPRGSVDAELLDRAAEIRGAQVFVDHGGEEALRFGATMGTTLVYGRDGARRR